MKKLMILLFIAGILAMGCQQTPSSISGSSGGGDERETSGVVIDPKEVTLPPNGFQVFKATVTGLASTEVKWEVIEANGGAIDQGGFYTAPNHVGDFHVVVASVSDPSKKDTALVHVDINASGNPYYTGTIDLEITGMYSSAGGTYVYNDDKETLEVNLDYDSSIGTPPSFTLWHNYIGNHTNIKVTGKIHETMWDAKGNIVYYITTNGFQSFTTTNTVKLGLDSINKKLTLDIYGIKYDNAVGILKDGTIFLNGYPMAGASIEAPLPIDLSNLSGTAMQSGLPGSMQIKVTWNLKRTF